MKRYIVKQESDVDCGAACLQSIVKYYNGYVPLEIIKVDTLTNSHGTSFFHLKEAAIKYGFDAKGIKTGDLTKVKLPCIIQLNINNFEHFVVIYQYSETVTIMEPSRGIVKITLEDLQKQFTGYVLELIPNGQIMFLKNQKEFSNVVLKILKEHYKSLIVLLLLSIPIIGLSLLSSFNAVLIFEKKLIVLAIIVIIVNVVISYIKDEIMSRLNKKINMAIIKSYLNHIFNLPLNYLQLKKVGELTNKINDLYQMKDVFSNVLVTFLTNSILIIGAGIILLLLNLQVALVILGTSIIYLVISYFLNKDLYLKIINIMGSDNVFMSRVIEYLSQLKTLKNLNVNYFLKRVNNDLAITLNNKEELAHKYNFITMFESFCEEMIFVAIMLLVFKQKQSYMHLILVITIYNYYLKSLKYFISLLPLGMYFKSVFNRVGGIFAIAKELESKPVKWMRNAVVIKELTYSYNQLNEVISQLNLVIKKGSKVLLKGDNGSGKSTLLALMAGNIKDYQGEIKLGGEIVYVSQNSALISDSILNNIILELEYNEQRFEKVVKITGTTEIINKKASGKHAMVDNSSVSGGERQRMILARSLYRKFDILLLDEAFSEINKTKRAQIMRNIFWVYKNKTIINVSHTEENFSYDQIINLTARKERYVDK